MNQIINMVTRLFMRKLVSKGIDAGFNKASKMRKPKADGAPHDERRQRQAGRQGAKQAKQAMKVMRRVNKF
ncbi:hypothetical protein K3756_07540 [Sulfitobacter sp. S190]|nr:hypothetical protein K3756_07540 [Sulfitobacter sp. S190]